MRIKPAVSAYGKAGTMPRMRPILETVAVVITFVLVFILVKELKTALFRPSSMQEASDAVSATAEKQIRFAQGNVTSNKSTTEILVDKARTHANLSTIVIPQ